ncbi:glycosyltransferase family 39 protein, partial [Candidatus Saccharibacteria bacterium]|nr:glycosyltransferase family 39 protein [Candidatus Saccharibacteria bacterium]
MGKLKISDFYLYKWRYPIAYFVFGFSILAFIVVAGLYIPGGLSQQEITSALSSDSLNPHLLFSLHPSQLLFLPYNLLQAATIAVFGFTTFSIKLPSIILAIASAGGILILLSIWFRRNVAIVTSIMVITTGQFLLVAQNGQPAITYIFWAIAVLLTASLIIKQGKLAPFWVIIAFVLAGLSLYMLLNIYVILALAITTILHPHARHILLRETSKVALGIGTALLLIIVSPLVLGMIHDHSIIATMLGIPQHWSSGGQTVLTLLHQYGNFMNPKNGIILQPIYSLGTLLLILLGLFRIFTTKYTTKSYIIIFWLILVLPFVFLHPNLVSITYVPAVLLIAQAVDYLFTSWYRLFPRNPYARIFGLLPLGVLVLGVVVSNVDRYAYGYYYSSDAYTSYSRDLRVLSDRTSKMPASAHVTLLAATDEVSFYQAYSKHQRSVASLDVVSASST